MSLQGIPSRTSPSSGHWWAVPLHHSGRSCSWPDVYRVPLVAWTCSLGLFYAYHWEDISMIPNSNPNQNKYPTADKWNPLWGQEMYRLHLWEVTLRVSEERPDSPWVLLICPSPAFPMSPICAQETQGGLIQRENGALFAAYDNEQ